MNILRWIVGRVILALNWITAPKPMKRPNDQQLSVNEQTKGMSLYQFEACPFCVKVRRKIRKLNLQIDARDTRNNTINREALLQGGGKSKVPCLRIESESGKTEWMYESSDINSYLDSRFS